MISNRIRKIREDLGLSRKEVGGRVDVSESTVGAWERGDRKPKNKNRKKLARALNCTVYDLYPHLEAKEAIEGTYGETGDGKKPPSPFAKHQGALELGESRIQCYVLDTGERVISRRATVHALTETEHGRLEDYLEVKPLQPVIDIEEIREGTTEFYIPNTGVPMMGKGIEAGTFLDICDGYVEAMDRGLLETDRQREIAVKASILLSSCAKTGLIALIDEATGYQYERAEDALQMKLQAFIAEEMRDWEKTFPDELWEEFGRLTGWDKPLHRRPKWWGKLVIEMIYEALDADVAKHLRENKPPPRTGQNYHQWLSENYGLKQLIGHIREVIGIAKQCETMRELRRRVAETYGHRPVQMTMNLPRKNRNRLEAQ